MHLIDGPGHLNNTFVAEDPASSRPPTEITAEWLNAMQGELANAILGFGGMLDKSKNTQLAELLARSYVRRFSSGQPLPASDIGPIWHADYESVLLWRTYSANGASYTGYASVDVGRVVWETQPTPRTGYVGSGAGNLSRTTYAALRNWAIHSGVLVAAGAWAAGTLLYKDNADGATFVVADVRGEFPRFLDAGRGVDVGRACGSWQAPSYISDRLIGAGSSDPKVLMTTTDGSIVFSINDGIKPSITAGSLTATGYAPRIRNIAGLAVVKY